jgi:hypothetical protein
MKRLRIKKEGKWTGSFGSGRNTRTLDKTFSTEEDAYKALEQLAAEEGYGNFNNGNLDPYVYQVDDNGDPLDTE